MESKFTTFLIKLLKVHVNNKVQIAQYTYLKKNTFFQQSYFKHRANYEVREMREDQAERVRNRGHGMRT